MSTFPQVSIIMPAYNAARFIGEAIRSVQAQTLSDWELIIVDDGSVDSTPETVRSFEDPRIRYVQQAHSGPSAARNQGLQLARGHFIAFLDADDLFLPHKLYDQVEFLLRRPEVGLVVGGHHYIDKEGRILSTHTPWTTFPTLKLTTWLFDCPAWPPESLIRREQLERIRGFDVRITRHEDYDLMLRLAYAGCEMEWGKQVVYCYRLHERQRSHLIDSGVTGLHQVFEKFFAQSDLSPEIRALRDAVLKRWELKIALQYYAAGDPDSGAAHLGAFLADQECTYTAARDLATTLGNLLCTPRLGIEPLGLVDRIWAHLPREAEPLKPLRPLARASTARHLFFEAWQRGDRPAMRRMFWEVLRCEPRLLDRGMLSVLAEALFGPNIAQVLRKFGKITLPRTP